MNVYDYIDEYGIYSFDEKPFNKVDATIFSFLVYADLKLCFKKSRMTIKELGRVNVGIYKKKDNNVLAVREGNKLLGYLKDTKRYKDCLVYNFSIDETQDIQFCAISIEYLKNKVFVAFEGTNALFSGWKENFLLTYEFPTKTHKKAIAYLNRLFTFSRCELLVGGHSKGGNLAMVASMYANIFVQRKIKFVYNLDGPGVLDEEFNSVNFKHLKKKYIHIIPDYSVVGMCLNNANEYVIKASVKSVYCHNIVYWEIGNDHDFVKAELSDYSKELRCEFKKLLRKYSNEDKKNLIINLFDILDKANITSILELKEQNKKIISLIYESKNMTQKTKKFLDDFIRILIKCYSNSTYNELKVKVKEVLNFRDW